MLGADPEHAWRTLLDPMPDDLISVHDLRFTYPGGTQAVRGADFDIKKGEIFGFLGPSGAGKSTVQKILVGLLRDFEGDVRILGKDRHVWGNDFFEHVGVSFELPNHYSKLTALENLNLFRNFYSGTTREPMDLLQLVDLDEAANQRVGTFSKGMKMRLNFIRALIHQPDLLFLDEPTAGLDPVNARTIKDLIRAEQQRGSTIFLTTHDMYVADDLCDRVAFIVGGEIALIDAPRSLKLKHSDHRVRVEYRTSGTSQKQDYPLADLGTNEAFLELLRTYPVETIHTLEATLEEIFIRTTGHRLQ